MYCAGSGPSVNVSVIVGGVVASAADSLPIRYASPAVLALSLERDERAQTLDCSVVTPAGLSVRNPTGNVTLVVDGTNFGSGGAAVAIRGHDCAVLSLTRHQRIVCVLSVPLCTGDVVVTLSGLSSQAAQYRYSQMAGAPVVTSVTPLTGPAAGGTLVTIVGVRLGSSTVVTFRELTADLVPTGAAFVCDWRNGTDTSANATAIRCRAPPLTSIGRAFAVAVSAPGTMAQYDFGVWRYEPPVVGAITPAHVATMLPPTPALHGSASLLTAVGSNFGSTPGRVSVAGRSALVRAWNNTHVAFVAPVGVVASGSVLVFTAGGDASAASPIATVHYLGPEAFGATLNSSDTDGGGVVVVSGASFNVDPMPLRVWLVRGAWLASSLVPTAADTDALPCSVVNQSRLFSASNAVACVIPAGSGTDWRFVVVNYDLDDATGVMMTSRWRASAPSEAPFAYNPPVTHAATTVGAKPAVGGFVVLITGANLRGNALYVQWC